MDEFFETRSTLAKTGCILILPERWEYRCASLTTQPCKRSAVISAAGACCFWGLEQGLDPRWYGVEISCHSSWATSPTRTKTSLRTISVCPAWRNWAKENKPQRPSPVSRKFLPNDPSTANGLDFANRRHHDGAPNKRRKYEEPHSPHYLGAIDRDDCAAGTHFVCSKRGCDVKGSGDSTTA